jgi:hypothetical protein
MLTHSSHKNIVLWLISKTNFLVTVAFTITWFQLL